MRQNQSVCCCSLFCQSALRKHISRTRELLSVVGSFSPLAFSRAHAHRQKMLLGWRCERFFHDHQSLFRSRVFYITSVVIGISSNGFLRVENCSLRRWKGLEKTYFCEACGGDYREVCCQVKTTSNCPQSFAAFH